MERDLTTKPETTVTLRSRQAGPAIGGHPWVYAGKIGNISGQVADGDVVKVRGGDDGRFIAYGLFNSKSDIRIRLYSWKEEQSLDASFWKDQIERAVSLRASVYGPWQAEQARRLIFSESDGLSGLVVDRYGEFLVIQCTSLGLSTRLESIVAALRETCHPKGIFVKGVKDISGKEGLEISDSLLWGEPPSGPVQVREGEVQLEVDLAAGQKTGLYLDQAENRIRVGEYAKGKRVLDLFCYTGGFSLQAARAGALAVVGVDSSAKAIQQAEQHERLNGLTQIQWYEADAFEYMKAGGAEPFDLVIVDPPRFAASNDAKDRALKKYYRLNMEALKMVRPDGLLVTCSCSGRVTAEEWTRLLSSVARRSGRFLQIVEFRGASRDHPTSPHCPETQYLKCVIARVS